MPIHCLQRLKSQVITSHSPQFLTNIAPIRALFSTSALDWLSQFTNYEQKGVPIAAGTNTDDGFDLNRMERLLTALGTPHHAYPSIHIAGTKGKGSTATMISNIFIQNGFKTATYTSPHILSLNERLSINNTPISNNEFDALISRYSPLIEAQHPKEKNLLTHYEVLTALAFKYFQENNVDISVIEVGLGGSRDATNVLPKEKLLASVITAIGNDHSEALGGSIEKIAEAKAGIIKEGVPVILGRQFDERAEAVVLHQASELKCKVYRASDLIHYEPGSIISINTNTNTPRIYQESTFLIDSSIAPFLLHTPHQDQNIQNRQQQYGADSAVEIELQLGMLGAHQQDNAATALTTVAACIQQQQQQVDTGNLIPISTLHSTTSMIDTIKEGLSRASMPGRFQICHNKNRDTKTNNNNTGDTNATSNITYILDGAHTEESARALVDTVHSIFPKSPIGLVIAMAGDKQHTEICIELQRLHPVVVVFTQVAVAGAKNRAAAPGVLAAAWQTGKMQTQRNERSIKKNSSNNNDNKKKSSNVRTRELIQASLTAAVAKAETELSAFHAMMNSSLGMHQQCSMTDGGIGADPVLVVCGSLHAVGAALRDIENIQPLL